MQRGEIRVASFRPWSGMEAGKARPALVVQANWLNREFTPAGTIIVLPLTSQLWRGTETLRMEISPRGRLLKTSWVMVEKIQALDASRLRGGPLATLDDDEMATIDQKMMAVLGML